MDFRKTVMISLYADYGRQPFNAELKIFVSDTRVNGTPPAHFSSASAVNLNGEVYIYGGSTYRPQASFYKVRPRRSLSRDPGLILTDEESGILCIGLSNVLPSLPDIDARRPLQSIPQQSVLVPVQHRLLLLLRCGPDHGAA